ncbi:MAG: L-arabinose isomerase [Christensenella sp.]|nr:L-arabinose isomerase [Christensenella sp.]
MKAFNQYEIWFLIGSQHLYGDETLQKVEEHARAITEFLNAAAHIPVKIVCRKVVTSSKEIEQVIKEANYNDDCIGIMTWMHTFSPSKMWIRGLHVLEKPMLHLHTQFNRMIPLEKIDMDFMNLNQSAHGDREHGFIGARMRIPRKVVVGFYQDESVANEIGVWMRAAVGIAESRKLNVVRFGDNMRDVAVTEGDKVEAEIVLGWSVNTHGVGDLAAGVREITEGQIDALYAECEEKYSMPKENVDAVRYQLKIEAALRRFLEKENFGAFTTNFQDLWGMEQLPGLACQRLMESGYGFGGEGDWKIAALQRIMKLMGTGLEGGAAFMEDYTYHFEPENELILGAHMLEVDPSIAEGEIRVDTYPLGIGDRRPPARMIFESAAGKAITVSLVDMRGRMRMIAADVECVKPIGKMPRLPVASTMWKPLPDLKTSAKAWILSGGAHHSVLSYALDAEHMSEFAKMAGIEFIHIGNGIDMDQFERDLMLSDLYWQTALQR